MTEANSRSRGRGRERQAELQLQQHPIDLIPSHLSIPVAPAPSCPLTVSHPPEPIHHRPASTRISSQLLKAFNTVTDSQSLTKPSLPFSPPFPPLPSNPTLAPRAPAPPLGISSFPTRRTETYRDEAPEEQTTNSFGVHRRIRNFLCAAGLNNTNRPDQQILVISSY